MSRSTTKPLPANLPPLPPVPAGYDAWEYMGMGWRCDTPVAYASFKYNYDDWVIHASCQAAGGPEHHYIRAVKRPAKASAAKKTKKPERKAGRVVALIGTTAFRVAMPPIVKLDAPREALIDQAPVFVLPADAASVERMVEQAHDAFLEHASFRDGIRAALAAIGIAATGKGARK